MPQATITPITSTIAAVTGSLGKSTKSCINPAVAFARAAAETTPVKTINHPIKIAKFLREKAALT
ncbi:MAG: hypothetical protein KAJ86_07195 [Alphaproteobacteria bacterium]|nr:hypothetical protein [Alphaproteobacteria bacterium]